MSSLKRAAWREANRIRKNTNEFQKSRLHASLLDPWDSESCPYGLMFGLSTSKEAIELKAKCRTNRLMSMMTTTDQNCVTALELFVTEGDEEETKKIINFIKNGEK